jgi:hypothetical protein
MIAASFDEANTVLDTPKGMTPDNCEPLSVWRGPLDNGIPAVISCWKLTQNELEEINRTGRVWLLVMGSTMPPVALSGSRPFQG